jgi:3-methylcrotonyl-CoA carboxylase alpha subunit
MTHYDLTGEDGSFAVDAVPEGDGYRVTIAGEGYFLRLKRGAAPNSLVAEFSDKPVGVTLLEANPQRVEMSIGSDHLSYQRPTEVPNPQTTVALPQTGPAQKNLITAPMPGKVIGALVKKGEKVRAGDPLVMLESMKMEVAVRADRDAEVEEILAEEGTAVKRGQGLVRLG